MINEDIEIWFGGYSKLISYAQEIPQGRRKRDKGVGGQRRGKREGKGGATLYQGSKCFPCNISFNVKQTLRLNYYYPYSANEVFEV